VALAFMLTAHATWHSLAVQSGLGTAAAQRLATDALFAAINGSSPDRPTKSICRPRPKPGSST
jgi:hypothetical protein